MSDVLQFKKEKHTKRKFTPEEDQIIINMTKDQKYPNWGEISKQIPGKSSRQVRERYQHYLSPNVSNEPWSTEEDALLADLFKKYGTNWAQIAVFMPGRTNTSVKNRYNSHVSKKCTDTCSVVKPSPPNPCVEPLPSIISQNDAEFSDVDFFEPLNGYEAQFGNFDADPNFFVSDDELFF